MKRIYRLLLVVLLAVAFRIAIPVIAVASVPAEIGPYRVRIATAPGRIPVGKAQLRIEVTDAAGKPVVGAAVRSLVKMPAMSMGEKETVAQPLPGKPGSYTTEASFAMEGGYEASIAIAGPLGEASGKVALETGQDTAIDSSGSTTLVPATWWLSLVLFASLATFVVYRMRKTGQRIAWQSVLNRGTIGGVLLLVIAFAVSRYAITHWRRPGAMTPIEAQGMEMSTPAPPGAAPVTLAEAARGPIENTVSYPGQAVAFNQQDVIARTEGWLSWMPFYVGQKVKADEVVARLDINLLHAHLGEREAAVNIAAQGVSVSERGRLQSLAETERMRAELRSRNDALAGAQADVTAAQEERAAVEAALASRQSMIAEAEAMVAAMEADRQFWQQQNARNKMLLDKGALSTEEYQRDNAMAANASAKVQQGQSRLAQAQADVKAAQAGIRKAEAMIVASEKKRQQMASDVLAAEFAIRVAEASTEVSVARVEESRAGLDQTRASLAVTTVTHGFAEIRTQIEGVVIERRISPGQLVSPGQAILKIAQTDPIRLQANIAEVDLARIKVGYRFTVRGQDDTRPAIVATVTSIAPTVDPTTRTGVIEAVAANPDGRFVPGQFIAVDISMGRSDDALRVPLAAIHTRAEPGDGILAKGAASYVWLAEPSGVAGQYTVKSADVQTGVSDGLYVQILSGVEAAQKVVVSGSEYLKRGDTVLAVGGSEVAR